MIYLAADIHGHIGLKRLRSALRELEISEGDFLIILGDAGIVWNGEADRDVVGFYNELACRTMFIDGNHENFALLATYPIVSMFGGSVHCISDKIAHMRRGELFVIEGKSIFAFGGGFSSKKLTDSSPVFVWEEEMPNDVEYVNGAKNLEDCGLSVDYILTHEAPTHIANSMGARTYDEELTLTNYLQDVSSRVRFSRWYFGHYHRNWSDGRYRCLYDQVIRLGE